MDSRQKEEVALRRYSEQDLGLLHRLLGDPKMMEHLGGPESEEAIKKRHERYLKDEGCYTITYGSEKEGVGWVGYWEREWKGEKEWETGWSVVPEYQGKGIATRATKLVLEKMKKEQTNQYVHAFPAIDNPASNAICRKAGFALQGEEEVEYPKGHMMRCNDWRKDVTKKE